MPILCEIVTQERLVYSDEVDMVVLNGAEGQMGILPNHAPLLTTLQIGELRIKKGSDEEVFAVGGGVLEVRPDKITVLADAAEGAEEIDLARAEAARTRAEEFLAEGPKETIPPDVYHEITIALQRANVRLRIGRKRRGSPSPMEFGGSEN